MKYEEFMGKAWQRIKGMIWEWHLFFSGLAVVDDDHDYNNNNGDLQTKYL